MPLKEVTVCSSAPMPKGYSFLPKGIRYKTLHSRKLTHEAGKTLYVVLDTNKRQLGLRVPSFIIHQVHKQAKETLPARRAAVEKRDATFIKTVAAQLEEQFPEMPETEKVLVTKHGFRKHSGRVGRTGQLPLPRKVLLAVLAHVRHRHTRHITEALLKKNRFTITAISRHDSRAEFLSDIQVRRVDYDDKKSIEDALKIQDTLIVTASVFVPKDTSATLTRAATAAGVSFWYEHSLSNGELYGIDIKKREVTFFDDGIQRLSTSTWPQVSCAVAALLSPLIDANDQQSDAVTLNAYRNRIVYVSPFTVNQREMFDSAKRIAGTSDEQLKISRVPAKERFKGSRERMKSGDRRAFARVLYTRYFFEGAGLFEKLHGLDNDKLGLPREGLDKYTEKAMQLEQDEYWAKYGL
ncbi:hypothetical protein ST47_g169 [Ascochyta rabiei]|uniref:DUF2293 domain-containing protein n=2 Tax=Didymella rabiei TaxID=5454 RepID=A0A163MGU9_DIDRA|nr:hypothetical protein ST47_g169 [Ascochyta rabiei]